MFREFPVPRAPLARRPRLVDAWLACFPTLAHRVAKTVSPLFQIRDFLLHTFVFCLETLEQIQNIVELAENLVAAVFLLFGQLILLSCQLIE